MCVLSYNDENFSELKCFNDSMHLPFTDDIAVLVDQVITGVSDTHIFYYLCDHFCVEMSNFYSEAFTNNGIFNTLHVSRITPEYQEYHTYVVIDGKRYDPIMSFLRLLKTDFYKI